MDVTGRADRAATPAIGEQGPFLARHRRARHRPWPRPACGRAAGRPARSAAHDNAGSGCRRWSRRHSRRAHWRATIRGARPAPRSPQIARPKRTSFGTARISPVSSRYHGSSLNPMTPEHEPRHCCDQAAQPAIARTPSRIVTKARRKPMSSAVIPISGGPPSKPA